MIDVRVSVHMCMVCYVTHSTQEKPGWETSNTHCAALPHLYLCRSLMYQQALWEHVHISITISHFASAAHLHSLHGSCNACISWKFLTAMLSFVVRCNTLTYTNAIQYCIVSSSILHCIQPVGGAVPPCYFMMTSNILLKPVCVAPVGIPTCCVK